MGLDLAQDLVGGGGCVYLLVPLMKYPKTGGVYFVWPLRHAQTFAIYFFNPCFRVLHEGDE